MAGLVNWPHNPHTLLDTTGESVFGVQSRVIGSILPYKVTQRIAVLWMFLWAFLWIVCGVDGLWRAD